jgi:alpha-tubulin suppressor-like RCC1 family protein
MGRCHAVRLLVASMALVACSTRVDVFEVPSAVTDAAVADAGTIEVGCGACAPLELCAINHCIDAAGTSFLVSGLRHLCAVTSGALRCWGDNGGAQLGLGDSRDRASASAVGRFDDWLYAAGGQQHTCAIRSPGTLYCWGENSVGQLGTGDTDPRPRPVRVPGSGDFAQVACGGDNCCALRAGGALYCWGDNLEGNPGQDDAEGSADVLAPASVARGSTFTRVSVGAGHSCAVRADGALYCWGRNTDGQLGVGSGSARRAPTRVGSASDWRAVAVAQHHSCGVRGDGELYCWGRNEFFELGIGAGALDDATLFVEPVRVGRDTDWSAVALGSFHTCALKRSGALYCFGRALEGQLGIGVPVGDAPISVPTLVATALRFRSVTLGSFHSCALDADRRTHCWGANTEGQLGLADVLPRDVPVEVDVR